MKIDRKTLLAELGWVQRFVDKKTTIPILSNVLFDVDGKRLTLTATDLEHGGITHLTGSGRGKWSVTAPVKALLQYLKKIDENEVELSKTDNNWLVLTHGESGKVTTAGMSRDSFPELPTPQEKDAVATLGNFATAVARVAFAISSEETRFTLNGALLHATDADEAMLVATDGHRLSLFPLNYQGAKLRAILPTFAIREAAQLDGVLAFRLGEAHAWFTAGERTIVTRKLTGNFPDWERVIEMDFPHHAMLPVDETLKTLERVVLYADERSRAVKLNFAKGKLTISACTVENGQAEGSIALVDGKVGVMEAGYNADYLTDFLRVIKQAGQPNIALCYTKPERLAQLLAEDGHTYGVMPMRI